MIGVGLSLHPFHSLKDRWDMMGLKDLFQRAAVKWEIVVSTRDVQEYYRVVGTLKNNRIPFKTKTIRSERDTVGKGEVPCVLQVLVPYESINQAKELIQ